MHEFLLSIEELSISDWVRSGQSIWGYATILFLHVVGMAMVAGVGCMIDLRLLGVAKAIPIKPLERLYPVMWTGFVINLLSGTALGMADATVKLTNPVFWVKMLFVALGLAVMIRMRKKIFGDPGLEQALPAGTTTMAWVSLACWLIAIVAGRLLGYTGDVAGLAAGL